jgi:prolyl oligopeptidase
MKPMWSGLLWVALHAVAAPPVAEVQDVPTVHHGVTVHDPYRWLEDVRSPRAQAWMLAQGQATRELLDRIDQRSQIESRLGELRRNTGDNVRSVTRLPGNRIYYLKRAVGENQFKLVMRQGLAGAERVLVDPAQETARTGVPHAINHFSPSWDGRYLAYGMSAGGSEQADLRVLDLASGKTLGAPVPRVLSAAHWLPDGRGLLFNQLKAMAPGEPDTEYYMDSRVFLLRLAAPDRPVPVFGRTDSPALALDRLDVGELITAPGSRWVVARTTDTTVPEGKLFVAPVTQLGRAGIKWRAIGEPADKMQAVALKGERLYVLTGAGAPRNKVVAVDLRRGTLKTARDVVSEPQAGKIEWMLPTRSGLLVGHRTGTQVQPRRHAPGDLAGQALRLPTAGAAWPARAPAADHDDVIVSLSTWTAPGGHLRLVGSQGLPLTLRSSEAAVQAPQLQATEVEFPSHDGVAVPMTLLHRQGLKLDGSNPVLLIGYASYGCQRNPGHAVPAPRRGGLQRTPLRLRRPWRHRRVGAPAGRARARGGQDPGDAGRQGPAADRADARRLPGQHQEPGACHRREVGRTLQARGGAAPQRLPGGGHLALRHEEGDAGVRGGQRAGPAAHPDQRRPARLPGGHRPVCCWPSTRCWVRPRC